MKKLLLIFILMFILSACDQESNLSIPTHVRYQEETVLWDAVDQATSYTVILNHAVYNVEDPSFDMHDYPNGVYQISVRANDEDLMSLYSSTLSFVLNRIYDHPTSISIQEDVLIWQPIDDAIRYLVLINDDEYFLTIPELDLSFLDENSTYELQVKAIFEFGESMYSSTLEYLTYLDTITSYEGSYNINLSYDLSIPLLDSYTIDHVFYHDVKLNIDDFIIQEDLLMINFELLQNFTLGEQTIELYTSSGIIDLKIDIVQNTKPLMISSNSVDYVFGQDIELLFEVFDGSFESLSSHDILASDYHFEDGVLTIYATYLDPKIATFEGSMIIFNYRLQAGDSVTLGYIFIRIP